MTYEKSTTKDTNPAKAPNTRRKSTTSPATWCCKARAVDVSGPQAQRIDFGMNIPLTGGRYGDGLLFLPTKPEARVADWKLAEQREQAARGG